MIPLTIMLPESIAAKLKESFTDLAERDAFVAEAVRARIAGFGEWVGGQEEEE